MKIAFMGFDSEERMRVIGELRPMFEEMGLDIYEVDRVVMGFDKISGMVTNQKYRKKAQRWIDYWHVLTHYFKKNFVCSTSIYDAWASARVSVSPWYHDILFTWAYKHIWYDHLFYVHHKSLEVADVDKERELNIVVSYSRVPYHVITGSTEDKIDQIKVILGRI